MQQSSYFRIFISLSRRNRGKKSFWCASGIWRQSPRGRL